MVTWAEIKDEFETPTPLFRRLDRVFQFDYDPCATEANALCLDYSTIKEDGLAQSWVGRRVFFNPPYSKGLPWAIKAFESLVPTSNNSDTRVTLAVGLLLCDTSTELFRFCQRTARYIEFLPRLSYYYKGEPAPFSARFASMLVHWW